jgi:tRNA A37 threonylcarbamoyladenosine modification protein TsaB
MDARSERIYTGIYKWEKGQLITVKEQLPCNIGELIEILNGCGKAAIFNGDGSVNYRDIIEEKLEERANFAPNKFNYLSASTLASIGFRMALKGELIQASEFKPQYLRLSQAERNKK